MITAEPYEFEGERFVKLTSELGGNMDVTEAEYAQIAGGGRDRPGRQVLVGYRLRDYGHAVTLLTTSRVSRLLSQVDLAAQLGVTRSQMWRWETGRTKPHADSFLALADALGYDLALVPREELA